jgi:hypothetical protein
MMVFAIRIEHPLVVTVQGSHDADAREHRRAAARHEHQRFDRSLPLLGLVLGLRELCDVGCSFFESDKLATARQRDWIIEFPRPIGLCFCRGRSFFR